MSTTDSQVTLQVQAVIYHNEKKAIQKAIEALCNSFRNDQTGKKLFREVTLYYGDSSGEPTFSEEEIQRIRASLPENVFFEYRFFGFNSGTSKGHNRMAEKCKCDYLIIMNPDIILSPMALDRMLEPFADPTVGIVEAKQMPVEHPKEYDPITRETEWASGACFMIRRVYYEQIGGFDEDSFFLYCDDVDLSWRLRLEGYRIIYQPLSPVFHAKRLSSDAGWQPTDAELYYSAEAALLMAYKWSNKKRLRLLLRDFQKGSEYQKRAYRAFIRRKSEGQLPKQMDPEHKISRFIGNDYTKSRYTV